MRKSILLAFLLSLYVVGAHAAVTRNAVSTTGSTTIPAIDLSGGGFTNDVLFLIESREDTGNAMVHSTSCTFDSVAMTAAPSGSLIYSGAGQNKPGVKIWYLVNPNNVNAAPSCSGSTSTSAAFGVVLLEGVDQTTPVASAASDDAGGSTVAGTTGVTINPTGVADGYWLAGTARNQGAETWTWSVGTKRLDSGIAGFDASTADAATTAGSFAITATTASATVNSMVIVAVIINPASSCSGSPSAITVDNDDTVTATQADVTYVVTNGCASGTVTLEQSGNSKTLSQDSYADTSGQVDMSGVGMGVATGLLYGLVDFCVTNAAANKTCKEITVNAPSGTSYANLSGGLVTLASVNNSPNRPFADPKFLQATSQVAWRNVTGTGCDETDLTWNADGSISITGVCTGFTWDYTYPDGVASSHLYVGTEGTWPTLGMGPEPSGIDFGGLVLHRNVAMNSIDFTNYFLPGEAALATASAHYCDSAADSTVNVSGDQTDVSVITVDDASALVDNAGDYLRFGVAGAEVRLAWADPENNKLYLHDARTVLDGDDVYVMAVNTLSIPGLSLDANTFVLSGTPTTAATHQCVFFRITDDSGQTADTR